MSNCNGKTSRKGELYKGEQEGTEGLDSLYNSLRKERCRCRLILTWRSEYDQLLFTAMNDQFKKGKWRPVQYIFSSILQNIRTSSEMKSCKIYFISEVVPPMILHYTMSSPCRGWEVTLGPGPSQSSERHWSGHNPLIGAKPGPQRGGGVKTQPGGVRRGKTWTNCQNWSLAPAASWDRDMWVSVQTCPGQDN